jgi:hypothetical protein
MPVVPNDEDISDDDWCDELEERRTPDGRSSKTFYELRTRTESKAATQNEAETSSEQVIECKNPCIEENYAAAECEPKLEEKEKTDDVRYEFVVDRVLGVQV